MLDELPFEDDYPDPVVLPAEIEFDDEPPALEREGLWLLRRDWDARTVEVWDRPTPRLM